MALSDNELILLDNLMYFDQGSLDNGMTVSEIAVRILDKVADPGWVAENDRSALNTSSASWKRMAESILSNRELGRYTMTNCEMTSDSGDRPVYAACFVDDINNPTDVNVAFKGTTGGYEWHDNGEGAYMTDTKCQMEAAGYINRLPEAYGNHITVTGHSKGGNKAQYVTITTDRVERCVSVDGQGFSPDFCKKYADQIQEKKDRLVNICADGDYVNAIAITIARQVYIRTEGNENYHKPDILLDENGNLREEGSPKFWRKLINEYTTYITENMPEPARSFVIDGVIGLVEPIMSGEEAGEGWIQKGIGVAVALKTIFDPDYFLKHWAMKEVLEILEVWFDEGKELFGSFLEGLATMLSPSGWYDLSHVTIYVNMMAQLEGNMRRYERQLYQMAEETRAARCALTGISYTTVRVSLNVLIRKLEKEAEICGKIAELVSMVCISYTQTDQAVAAGYSRG